MEYLSIDFETRSTTDLRRTSVYRYAEDPNTDIWCMAYAVGDYHPRLWLPGDPPPAALVEWVEEGRPLRAWNAQFERIIWRFILGPRYGFPRVRRDQWYCTQAEALAQNLPAALGKAARVLGTPAKDAGGRRLMLQMAKPRKIDDDGTIIWWDVDEKRESLYEYCRQDVVVERAIARKIRRLPAVERETYLLDQLINDRGVAIDMALVEAAQKVSSTELARVNDELREITGGAVEAVTRVPDMTAWLDERIGMPNLQKATVRDKLEEEDLPEDARRVLLLRQEAGKSSVSKLDAFERWVNSDGRCRGMLQYYGASSTGRWAGRGPQPQNLLRPEVDDVEDYIPAVLDEDVGWILGQGEDPMTVLASLLRSCIIAAPGHRLMGIDYSQIEARITAWYAEQEDLLDAFARGEKVYEQMAEVIYGIPADEVEKDSRERQVGKGAVLGGGFQMGWEKFQGQIYTQTGIWLSDTEAEEAIEAYRAKNWRIKQFWYEIEDAATQAVCLPGKVFGVGRNRSIKYTVRNNVLWCRLPSGRFLAYSLPAIEEREVPWGGTQPSLTFAGINSYTKKWERMALYGGWLTENVVQAMARDLLRDGMFRLEDAGYKTILTVHDEILLEVPEDFGSLQEAESVMSEVPEWALELPVAVEGWEGERYRK